MNARRTRFGLRLSLAGAFLVGSVFSGAPVPPQEREACGTYCGTERWSVKTLSDADRNKVDFTPKEATVGWLTSQDRPTQSPADQRIGPIETQTYKVRARLINYAREADGDFHIVIADVEDPSKTMIAEIPSPDCAGACASGHVEEFQKARAVIMGLSEQVPRVTVVVTGVGFFDFLHGQAGAPPNGIELHPVLKIEPESDSGLLPEPSPPQTKRENKKEEVVWVNTSSGVYHCQGTRWYGITKQGKYMGECEAKKAGYRPAYDHPCGSGCL